MQEIEENRTDFWFSWLGTSTIGIKAYAADTAAPTSKDVRFAKTLVSPASNLAEIPDMKFDFTFTGVGFYPLSRNGVADQADGSVTVPDLASQEIDAKQDMKAANGVKMMRIP